MKQQGTWSYSKGYGYSSKEDRVARGTNRVARDMGYSKGWDTVARDMGYGNQRGYRIQ
jgi:hypothetical protein